MHPRAYDVDWTICACAQANEDIWVLQVDLDLPEPIWLCLECLFGLEEW